MVLFVNINGKFKTVKIIVFICILECFENYYYKLYSSLLNPKYPICIDCFVTTLFKAWVNEMTGIQLITRHALYLLAHSSDELNASLHEAWFMCQMAAKNP